MLKLIRRMLCAAALISPSTYACSDADWMACINDSKYISELTIPGTHDSGARVAPGRYGIVANYVIAQELTIAGQLASGVRFFDIRFGSRSWSSSSPDKKLQIYHGSVAQGIYGDALMNDFFTFLNNHPTETLIVSIKDEDGSHPFAFEQMVYDLIARWSRFQDFSNAKYNWWLKDSIPKLSLVRGKLVVVRRFKHGGSDKVVNGLDAGPDKWPNNKTGEFRNFHVEDKYAGNFFSPQDKRKEVENHLKFVGDQADRRMYITFGSANGLGKFPNFVIREYSNKVNPYLLNFFGSHQGRFGIIAADLVDEDLVHTIWSAN